MRYIDLTGKIFVKWLVIRREGSQWLCRCNCGKEKVVASRSLRSGESTRCRDCSNKDKTGKPIKKHSSQWTEDLIGKKFGKWIVIKRDENVEKSLFYWVCRCDCGVEKSIYSSHLKGNKTISCRRCSEHKHKGKLGAKTIARIKWGAKVRNIFFDNSDEFRQYIYDLFYKEQNGVCALTGQSITIGNFCKEQTSGKMTASLDRIDSSKGYEKGNVQWVHKDVNRMKWVCSQQEFYNICKMVVEHLGKKGYN